MGGFCNTVDVEGSRRAIAYVCNMVPGIVGHYAIGVTLKSGLSTIKHAELIVEGIARSVMSNAHNGYIAASSTVYA